MERDTLEQLLRQTDRRAGQPRLSGDLAARVRRSHRKRQIVARSALTCVVSLILLGAIGRYFFAGRDAAERQIVKIVEPGDRRLDELMAKAEQLRLEVAELGIENAGEDSGGAGVGEDQTSQDAISQPLERAASLIAYQAERYERELGMQVQAAASYRQIVECFPATYAARTARARLAEMETHKGDRL